MNFNYKQSHLIYVYFFILLKWHRYINIYYNKLFESLLQDKYIDFMFCTHKNIENIENMENIFFIMIIIII
jgi:hypothetical protein